MRGLTFTSGGTTYRQITKKTAKKLYLQGFPVVLCPCNLRPFTPWHVEHVLKKSDRAQFVADEIGAANDFDNLVNSFEWYNCQNSETGKYTAFYVGEVSGLHLTFSNGSNPWLCFGGMETIQKQLKRWGKNYRVDGLTVSAGGIVNATLTEV